MHQADDSQLAKQKVVHMVGQIILGALGIIFGGAIVVGFAVMFIKPNRISTEELAAFEGKNKKKSKIAYIPPLKHIGGGMFAPNDIL